MVRELQNVVERTLILNPNGPLTFQHLSMAQPEEISSGSKQTDGIQKLDSMIARNIRLALSKTNGKIHGPGGAAELLGINPNTLMSRMKKLGIPFE